MHWFFNRFERMSKRQQLSAFFIGRHFFSEMNEGKIFSKIDLSEAYLQVKVDKECSKYLAINTHRDLFFLQHL